MMADLLRWTPWGELPRFTRVFDRLANRWRSGAAGQSRTSSPVDSVDDGYRVQIPLPGFAPEDVTVEVANRIVHVRAIERDGDTEVTRYEEVLTLPASVDAERIGATFRHGLLELTLPYQDAVKPRRIEIATDERKQLPTAA